MKKCPYCNAQLQDNAQFCYYCMKQFGQKTSVQPVLRKNRVLVIILPIIALVVMATALLVLWLGGFLDGKNDKTNLTSTPSLAQGEKEREELQGAQNSSETEHSVGNISDKDKNVNSSNDVKGDAGSSSLSDLSKNSSSQGTSSTKSPSSNLGTQGSSSTQSTQPQTTPQWEIRTVSGGVEITGIAKTNSDGVYSIPSKIDGKTVVGIGDSAFYYTNLKTITLPSTLKYIGEKAFSGCASITSIVIPKSVESISVNSFTNCKKLAHIYIAGSSVEIDNNAFSTQYQRDVELTIHAPKTVMNSINARLYWEAWYEEWNG